MHDKVDVCKCHHRLVRVRRLIVIVTMFEQIKEDLPNFPDEVIVDWLLPFAMTDGWPPRRMSRWENLLPHDLVDLSVLQKSFFRTMVQNGS